MPDLNMIVVGSCLEEQK